MVSMMGSSSHLKLVSCRGRNRGFLYVRDDLWGKAEDGVLKSSALYYCNHNNKKKSKDANLKLSFSPSRTVLPVSLSSSHTQAEVNNRELQLEELPDETTNETKTVHVRFQLQKECMFGQHFLIVGDDPMFGLWDPENAVPLTWSDGHIWTVELDVPIGKCIKFKFIMQGNNREVMWQPGPDRILEPWETDKTITLCEDWENAAARIIIEAEPTLDQTEESTVTPGVQIIEDDMAVPVAMGESPITNGTPNVLTLVAENIVDSKINTQKEEPLEPKGFAKSLKGKLVSNDGVPVLVAGLSPLPKAGEDQEEKSVNEALPMSTQAKQTTQKDEVESLNGATIVSAGAKMTTEFKLPELEPKEDDHVNNSSNLKQTTKKVSTDEKQEACESKHQEIPQLAEDDYQNTQSLETQLHNDIEWGKNAFQKLVNFLGIR